MTLGPAPLELLYCFEHDADGNQCNEKAIARGLCRRHYQRRWNKNQLPTKTKSEPKTVSFTIRLNEKMYSALSKQRRATGSTMMSLIECAISEQLRTVGLWPPKG